MPPKKSQPSSIHFHCLRQVAKIPVASGTESKPMLVGFSTARDLARVAKAPSFSATDSNRNLAEMLKTLPATRWQRPVDTDRVQEMAKFFNDDTDARLMPNPVLLAENPDNPLQFVHEASLVKFEIPVPAANDPTAPLWILDGQHRIAALARSNQDSNPIPFVLLPNEGGSYTREEFAAIFAQVTTAAKPLEEPHASWLQYSFQLGKKFAGPGNQPRRDAFRATVIMGAEQQASTALSMANPFAGFIRFNPRNPSPKRSPGINGVEGVFAFTAVEMSDLILKHYTKPMSKPGHTPMAPDDLGLQIALSVAALSRKVNANTAMFTAGNKYLQEGFLVGVLSYLREFGAPKDWLQVLDDVGMTAGSWDLTGRLIDTGGNHGQPSARIANGTFSEVFAAGALPNGLTSLAGYVLGDEGVRVALSFADSQSGAVDGPHALAGKSKVPPFTGRLVRGHTMHLTRSANVAGVKFGGALRPPEYWRKAAAEAMKPGGFPLDELADELARQSKSGVASINMEVWYEHYGGDVQSIKVTFTP
jgi:DGQHR domain-containing protein